jgi:hypothetical protein
MNRRNDFRHHTQALAGLLTAATCLLLSPAPTQAQTNGTDLRIYQRSDGETEVYFAANDGALTKAFELLVPVWNTFAANGELYRARGHLDMYLPLELRDMGHNAANAMEARLANYVFSSRSASTGLVPESNVSDMQFLRFPYNLAEFLRWSPADTSYQANVGAIANATATAMYGLLGNDPPGPKPMANVQSGKTYPAPLTQTMMLGWNAEGMAELTKVTNSSSYMDKVDPKLEWLWSIRPNTATKVLPEYFTLGGPLMEGCPNATSTPCSDSDSLYYVRSLFSLWLKLQGVAGQSARAEKYKTWALGVTDAWYAGAWNTNWNLFMRKLKFDGTQGSTATDSDAMYNMLYVLGWAYRATGDTKYPARAKIFFDSLVSRSHYPRAGIISHAFNGGTGSTTMDGGQHLVMDALVELYKATNDQGFLSRAQSLAAVMGPEGRPAWGGTDANDLGHDYLAGAAFLKLALAQQNVRRLECNLAPTGKRLQIRSGSNSGPIIFERTDFLGQVIVVYLPQGNYAVSVDGVTFSAVDLSVNRQLAF